MIQIITWLLLVTATTEIIISSLKEGRLLTAAFFTTFIVGCGFLASSEIHLAWLYGVLFAASVTCLNVRGARS